MLDEVPFEVERTLTVGGRPVVMARLLGPAGDFTVDEGATLDGRALEPYLDIPRVPRPDGTLRRDLFGFRLRHARDLSQFEPGARVLLRTVRRPPPTGID